MTMPDHPPLILASTSPRRAALLREAGFDFTRHDPGFDDSHVDFADAPLVRAAEALAYLKASSVADRIERGLVIGSDTMLAIADRPIGKPRDREHAAAMLDELFDHPHRAISAVALVDATDGRHILFHDIAEVTIARPDDAALGEYLESDAWAGKAGGYNLAELRQRWRFTVTGDPTTVVGLPMGKIARAVEAFARPTGS